MEDSKSLHCNQHYIHSVSKIIFDENRNVTTERDRKAELPLGIEFNMNSCEASDI